MNGPNSHGKIFPVVFLSFLAVAALGLSYEPASPARAFWVPKDPSGAEYVIDAKIAVEGGTASVRGKGTVVFINRSSRPLSILALEWTATPDRTLELSADGQPLRFLNEIKGLPLATPLFFELPAPVRPGGKIRLEVRFTFGSGVRDGQVHLQAWYPRLWWNGIPVRDTFKVKLDLPQGYVAAVSGGLDPKSGFYKNDSVTTRFAVFLSSAMKAEEVESEGVMIKALFTEKGRDCARLCLNAAVDIVKFYKTWLGVFPRKSLCIIPGGPQPWGGYPYASGIVVIHGQETYDPKKGEKEVNWWTWITAHEIGHQYWGEFVMPDDVRGNYTDSWLMIGMGICADKAYMLGRGHGWQQHRGFINGYLQGMRAKADTTMDAPPSLARTQKFDTNNVVIHGKGFTVLSALETLVGSETFEKIYRRTLTTFAGKRLGWRDFRRLCEEETGGDLGWFFEDWVRSNKVLECRIMSWTSEPVPGGGALSELRVEYGMDSLRMPVPVEAVFDDGTRELQWTDRFVRTNTLRFESRAKLKEARLDPEQRLAIVKEPVPKTAADLEDAIDNLEWTGTGEAALAIYKKPEAAGIKDAHAWFKMGLLLFDGQHDRESLEAFKKCGELDRSDRNLFGALVWMGNLADLLGDREKAVAYYREALKHDTGSGLQHDQYGLRINKAWVEERLKAPFKWQR